MRILLLLVIFFGGVLWGQNADPFSPTVSRQEAEQIQEALATFESSPEQAIKLLEKLSPEKTGAAVDFTLGNLYFQSQTYEDAKKAYERALVKFPAFRNAKINLGRIYLLLEDPLKAIGLYQELVRDGIADSETYLLLGHALLMESQAVSAESAYRHGLLLDQELLEAKQGLLNALMIQERYEEAVFLSRELLQADPTRRDFWAARANAELSLGKNDLALTSLEQARRLGSADGEMLNILGELYLAQGASEQAMERFAAAFEAETTSVQRQVQAIRAMLGSGNPEDAEQLLGLLEKRLAEKPEVGSELGEGTVLKIKTRLLVAQAKEDEAKEYLTELLRINPLDGESLLMYSAILHGEERSDESLLVLERAARVSGFEADSLTRQAMIRVEQNQYTLAITLMERAQVFEERAQVTGYLKQLRRMVE